MESKLRRLQIAKLLFLLFSLGLIPFVSSSLRAHYIYFILNSLIIVVGYESGVLPFLAEQSAEKKSRFASVTTEHQSDLHATTDGAKQSAEVICCEEKLEQAHITAEKSLWRSSSIPKVKKSPSLPVLFFIAGCDGDGAEQEATIAEEERVEEEQYDVTGDISGQELFARAESFIKNFYGQLKIQRENSFKKIHGLYQNTI